MASTFYVSPIGSDSQSGTLESPFASLEYAHAKAQPGDTILLRGGVYNPLSGIDLKSDGTSGKPITIASFPGEHAVLDGSRLPQGDYVINMQDASWNHLVGVEIRNGSEGGLIMQGNSHDNIIEQLDVHHNGGRSEWDGKGISLYGTGGNNLFLNNDSHDNRDLHGDNADGFQISSTGQGNVLSGNRAWGNSDDGFDLFNVQYGTQSGAVHLEGNWAFDNGFDASGNPLGDGNGFKLGGQRPDAGSGSGGHTLVHNEAWSNGGSGFDENDATAPSALEGNTAHDNGSYNFGFWEQDNTFQGDVSYGSGRLAISGSSSGSSWDVDAVPVATDPMTDADARAARGSDGSLPGMSAVTAPETATAAMPTAEPVTYPPTSVTTGGAGPTERTATGASGNDVLLGNASDDGITGGCSNHVLHGGTGDDTLKGGRGNDVLHGGAGDDTLKGGRGNDVLHGGAGDDTLKGGAGDDVLFGEGGNDLLFGGRGADTFVFGAVPGRDGGTATVRDFAPGIDHFKLTDGITLVSFHTLDINCSGRHDLELTLSDGQNIHVTGVSEANPWDWLV
ncbi:right-handed parallel beta-helix repeat-containing protein [Methylorubrum extorquens]